LVFVNQHMIEPVADIAGEQRIADGLRPIEQEVVVIEDVLRLLAATKPANRVRSCALHPEHQGK
jgi:hypothetical protein